MQGEKRNPMRVTLELSADEARVLQEISEAAGVTVDAVLHGLIAQVSGLERTAAQAAVPPADLEALNPEALAEQKREQEEVEANIKRWHQEQKPAEN